MIPLLDVRSQQSVTSSSSSSSLTDPAWWEGSGLGQRVWLSAWARLLPHLLWAAFPSGDRGCQGRLVWWGFLPGLASSNGDSEGQLCPRMGRLEFPRNPLRIPSPSLGPFGRTGREKGQIGQGEGRGGRCSLCDHDEDSSHH